jgi:hypothetical protein
LAAERRSHFLERCGADAGGLVDESEREGQGFPPFTWVFDKYRGRVHTQGMTTTEATRLRNHLNAERGYHHDLAARIATGNVKDQAKSARYLAECEAEIKRTLIALSDGGWL